MTTKISLIFTSMFFSTQLLAQESTGLTPKRGPDIQSVAGHCPVGPFGQDGETGEYKTLCNQLTRAEICFAYIKGHIEANGEVREAYDQAKSTFCAQTLLDRLTTR